MSTAGLGSPPPVDSLAVEHVRQLADALAAIESRLAVVERWSRELAVVLSSGGRLLAAGNGGSAAQAQHLTAELVGRYQGERRPLSAIALHAETSSVTAIVNDYGPDEVFRRQVLAHGRPGDVLVALSTSGRSPNLLAAVAAARTVGMRTWAMTGRAPNPLAIAADEVFEVPAIPTPTIQEVHLVAVHLLCEGLDACLARREALASGDRRPA